MPLYEYRCSEHGLFDRLVPVAERGEQATCPHCGQPSPRVLVSAPRVPQLTPARREAFERNERAAHEPRRGSLASEQAERQVHRPLNPSGALYTADGKKLFPVARPWMLGH